MKTPKIIPNSLLYIFLVTLCSNLSCSAAQSKNHETFIQCMSESSKDTSLNSTIVYYTPNNPSYSSTLQSRMWNQRFKSQPKPLVIVTPEHESQIPTIILCAKQSRLLIRTRSGGHDFEGLSYTTATSSHVVPFAIIDLVNLSEITVDAPRRTAWVQSGSTIGQLYYEISRRSPKLGFPAGICPTVGVGGHFSGGGYGSMLRKYGLAADHVIDARIVDVNGQIMDRKSMGEDLFWAIRGGGGSSFGVITAWKVNLVPVPETVTVFSISRTSEQNATALFHRWQYVAPYLPEEMFLAPDMRRANSTISVTFLSLFLGDAESVLALMGERFPELGLRREDCVEVSWVQSVLFLAGYSVNSPPDVLASRVPLTRLRKFKGKSDYVVKPVSVEGVEGIWRLMLEDEAEMAGLVFVPYGGRMSEVPEDSVPFPHRKGNLYKIQHQVYWDEPGEEASEKYISWIRRLYSYMGAYVSKFPRSAYVNYRDFDLGVNDVRGNTSYAQGSVWGFKYFKNNFNRLVKVKSVVDPSNFFRNEQSIPAVVY